MKRIDELFERFPGIKVGILGDVMLDTYMWGHVERISPEAPVPVVTLDKKDYRIGGAGNVALNIRSLGALSYVLSVTGDDEDAGKLRGLLASQDINLDYLLSSNRRITTNKTRIISRNQQMMRLDAEITCDLEVGDEDRLMQTVDAFIERERPGIIILEDYNKGVLTERVIAHTLAACRNAGVLTAVDPKRKNFFAYQGVNIFKPNLKEVRDALNLHLDEMNPSVLEEVHAALSSKLGHQISFITLSEKGVFYQQNETASLIPSHLRNIADVSGAGDTVIAVASLVYAATGDIRLMAETANIAGGLVCEEVGTVAINREKLLHECRSLLS